MFRLADKSDYSVINHNLKRFFKCSVCHLVPRILKRVCQNAHFYCDNCARKKKNYLTRKCFICRAPFTLKRLTVFNSMVDVMWNTPEDSSEFIEQLINTLECPICYEETVTSLNICNNGHPLCSSCSLLSDHCPLCREFFIKCSIEMRRHLEDALMDIPCTNQGNGCEAFNSYHNIKNHISECSFSSWCCGKKECSWSGKVETTIKHAKEFHPSDILRGRRARIIIQLDNEFHLQLWKRENVVDYKVFYKVAREGLKMFVSHNRTRFEKIILYLNVSETIQGYSIPCIDKSKNPSYFLTYECPISVPINLEWIDKPFLECLLQVEGRWYAIITFVIKAALMIIKLLTI